jgi:hypothetical protein
MTQIATARTALGDFDDVELEENGQVYRLSKRGDELWFETTPLDYRKASQKVVQRQIVLSTGSHHDQMYWHVTPGRGRDLHQFPFSWSKRLGRWIPAIATYVIPPGSSTATETGLWNQNCMHCHTTFPDMKIVRRPEQDASTWKGWRYDTSVAEFGIACEACHGPGETHVRVNADPRRRYEYHHSDRADETIVNPSRLSSKRSAEVCGQCHSTRKWREGAGRYFPGNVLADHGSLRTEPYTDPETVGFWPDRQIRVSGREYDGLVVSPCFERGELTCTTCHSMHQDPGDERPMSEWANDQLRLEAIGNGACLSCHPAFAKPAALAAHTRHQPESSGSSCYNCHMSWTSYGIQKAHRSHKVASPSVQESLEYGRPNACNQCHADKSLAWAAGYLSEWYGTPPVDVDALDEDERALSAGVLWALRGDAGQRVLMAWSFGWDAAREASGSDWMIPYLLQLLEDPYDSVRVVAYLALKKRPEFAEWTYDVMGSPFERGLGAQGAQRVFFEAWPTGVRGAPGSVLYDSSGALRVREFERLLSRRDNRRMTLPE